MFNPAHETYKRNLWNEIIDNIAAIRKQIGHKITPMDHGLIKRNLFTAMFFTSEDQVPPEDDHYIDPVFETIGYNPHERLDKYDGLSKAFATFASSGLGTSCGMSFNDYLELPFWLTEWISNEWLPLTRSTDENLEQKLAAELAAAEMQHKNH